MELTTTITSIVSIVRSATCNYHLGSHTCFVWRSRGLDYELIRCPHNQFIIIIVRSPGSELEPTTISPGSLHDLYINDSHPEAFHKYPHDSHSFVSKRPITFVEQQSSSAQLKTSKFFFQVLQLLDNIFIELCLKLGIVQIVSR